MRLNEELFLSPRCGKSIKYNRISKEKAYDICSRRLRPNKSLITPISCYDCYYHDGKCELGKDEGYMCSRFRSDISFSNKVHRNILYNYEWCLEHFHEFCELDKEVFVAIYGKKHDGLILIGEKNG